MAVYPQAAYRPIYSSTDPPIIPIGFVLHVDAGNAETLFNWFNGQSGGIESHFHIRKDGVVEQYRDTGQEADANYHGNSFVRDGKRYGFISVETQGFGAGTWTDQQLASIKALLEWGFDTHGIQRRVCPAWDQGGVGYHVMWGAPGEWTNAAGKPCPGPERIVQFNEIIVPWLDGEDEEMAVIPQPDWLPDAVLDRLLAAKIITVIPTEETYDYWRTLIMFDRMLNAGVGGPDTTLRLAYNAHKHAEGTTAAPRESDRV